MAPWTAAETLQLCELVKTHGFSWKAVSDNMDGRTSAQVRLRWAFVCASEAQANRGVASNRCGVCGQIKRGHVCGQDTISPRQIAASVRRKRRLKGSPSLPSCSALHTDTEVVEEEGGVGEEGVGALVEEETVPFLSSTQTASLRGTDPTDWEFRRRATCTTSATHLVNQFLLSARREK